jgi:hypothetical protein
VLLASTPGGHFESAVPHWADPESTMLVAKPVCFGGGGTIGCMASFESGSTVLLAESPNVWVGGAAWMPAHTL